MTTTTISTQVLAEITEVELLECSWGCGEPVVVSDDTEVFVDCDGPGWMHEECKEEHDRICTHRGCWPEEEPLDDWDR